MANESENMISLHEFSWYWQDHQQLDAMQSINVSSHTQQVLKLAQAKKSALTKASDSKAQHQQLAGQLKSLLAQLNQE